MFKIKIYMTKSLRDIKLFLKRRFTIERSLKNIKFKVIDGKLDCSFNQLTSLKGCPASVTTLYCNNNQLTSLEGCPENVIELRCDGNQLTSLEGCSNSVKELWCMYNQLTSLRGCSEGVTELHCDYNQLTSLEGCHEGVTRLYCDNNQLTSLEGCHCIVWLHCANNQLTSLKGCSNSVKELCCDYNQLTSLEGCPGGVTRLYFDDSNPLNSTYKNKSLEEIHAINRIKQFKKGITIVDNIILNYNARTIQKVWDDWWYKPDKQGESRVAKKQYAKLNYENNLQNKKISTYVA